VPPRTTTTPGAGVPARVTPIGVPRPIGPQQSEKVRRVQTSTQRDTAGLAARSERELRERSPIPFELPEEITGNYEGEELERIRALRPPEDRFHVLETKHDKLDQKVEKLDTKVEALDTKVDRVEVAVAGINGKMDLLPKMFESLQGELASRREDGHVILKQTLDVNTHEAKARIDTQKVAKESKWKMGVAVVTGVFSTAVITALITLLATKC
jgi:hypothetical protein